MLPMENADYILCECDAAPLEAFVRQIETECVVQVVRHPSIATTMIRAEDSVEGQPFYLGEALITECEVTVEGQVGFGVCLGDEPLRCYCIAVVDALMLHAEAQMEGRACIEDDGALIEGSRALLQRVRDFLTEQEASIAGKLAIEHAHIQRTKVDFKLMEED